MDRTVLFGEMNMLTAFKDGTRKLIFASKSMSWCMFDYFNKEIKNLTKPVLFTGF